MISPQAWKFISDLASIQKFYTLLMYYMKKFVKLILKMRTLISQWNCGAGCYTVHSVEITGILSRIFGKIFVKVTVLLNKLL